MSDSGIRSARDFPGRYSFQFLGKGWLQPAASRTQIKRNKMKCAALFSCKRKDIEIICLLRIGYNHSLTAVLRDCFNVSSSRR